MDMDVSAIDHLKQSISLQLVEALGQIDSTADLRALHEELGDLLAGYCPAETDTEPDIDQAASAEISFADDERPAAEGEMPMDEATGMSRETEAFVRGFHRSVAEDSAPIRNSRRTRTTEATRRSQRARGTLAGWLREAAAFDSRD